MDERRIARRYDVAVPVLVRQAGLRHLERPRGLTRDISTSGLYFTMDQPPRPGSRVELTLTLPGSLTGSTDVVVELVGRVVRVDTRLDNPVDAREDSRVISRVVSRADARWNPGLDSGAGAMYGAAAACAVGVAAHIEKYEIISSRPAYQGSAYAQ